MRFAPLNTAWEGLAQRREREYTRWQIILWWEHRRIYYNILLALLGCFSIFCLEYFGGKAVPLGEDAIEPMALFFGVPLFAIVANCCYTLGWIMDLLLSHKRPSLLLLLSGYGIAAVVTSVPAMSFLSLQVIDLLLRITHLRTIL